MDSSLVWTPYLFHFYSILNDLKIDGWGNQGFTKTSLYSWNKDATIKDFKLKILICFNALVTKHWTPLHQTPHIFPILLSNWTIFVMLQMLDGRLQMLFQF